MKVLILLFVLCRVGLGQDFDHIFNNVQWTDQQQQQQQQSQQPPQQQQLPEALPQPKPFETSKLIFFS